MVTISDGAPRCTCPDHLIRRRNCKHIKVVLAKLRILGEEDKWHEVRAWGPAWGPC